MGRFCFDRTEAVFFTVNVQLCSGIVRLPEVWLPDECKITELLSHNNREREKMVISKLPFVNVVLWVKWKKSSKKEARNWETSKWAEVGI